MSIFENNVKKPRENCKNHYYYYYNGNSYRGCLRLPPSRVRGGATCRRSLPRWWWKSSLPAPRTQPSAMLWLSGRAVTVHVNISKRPPKNRCAPEWTPCDARNVCVARCCAVVECPQPAIEAPTQWTRPRWYITSMTRRRRTWSRLPYPRTESLLPTSKMYSTDPTTSSSSSPWTMTSGECDSHYIIHRRSCDLLVLPTVFTIFSLISPTNINWKLFITVRNHYPEQNKRVFIENFNTFLAFWYNLKNRVRIS